MLSLKQYIPLAVVTEAPIENPIRGILRANTQYLCPFVVRSSDRQRWRLLHAAMGLCTESGELAERYLREHEKIDRENVFEELGDLCWYMALFQDAYPAVLEYRHLIQSINLHKLESLLLDLASSTSNFMDIAKKMLFYKKTYTEDEIFATFKEVERVIYVICLYFGFNIGEIREANIRKLAARYGAQFSEASANNRNIAEEMQALGFTV